MFQQTQVGKKGWKKGGKAGGGAGAGMDLPKGQMRGRQRAFGALNMQQIFFKRL